MSFTDRVAHVLASANLGVIVERIRGECEAEAVAILACVADGIRVTAAAPSRHAEEQNWQQCADACRGVLQTGLPIERRTDRDGEPMNLIICPVDADRGAFRGVIAMMRQQPFSTDDIDFVRLLGIELGTAVESLANPSAAGVNRSRAAGQ
jgi:hypothetical protein